MLPFIYYTEYFSLMALFYKSPLATHRNCDFTSVKTNIEIFKDTFKYALAVNGKHSTTKPNG